jgi:hypothetical protein
MQKVNKFFGVGLKSNSKKNFYNPLIWRKLYYKWYSILSRCYDKNSKAYKNYGEKNIVFSNSWLDFWNFANDARLVKGWSEVEFVKGNLELDKDILSDGIDRIYSKDKCIWVTHSENITERNKRVKNRETFFTATSPEGNIYYKNHIREFAKEYSLFSSNICECLKGRRRHTKGWTFQYITKEEYYEN